MPLSIILYIDYIFNLCDCQEKKNGLHPTRKHVGCKPQFHNLINVWKSGFSPQGQLSGFYFFCKFQQFIRCKHFIVSCAKNTFFIFNTDYEIVVSSLGIQSVIYFYLYLRHKNTSSIMSMKILFLRNGNLPYPKM